MVEKETKTKFYVCIDNEHCVPLSSISQDSLEDEEIDDFKYVKFDLDEEITVVIKPQQNFRELGKFIELVHRSLPWLGWWISTYGSNNWRKLHGLPMVRRKVGIERV